MLRKNVCQFYSSNNLHTFECGGYKLLQSVRKCEELKSRKIRPKVQNMQSSLALAYKSIVRDERQKVGQLISEHHALEELGGLRHPIDHRAGANEASLGFGVDRLLDERRIDDTAVVQLGLVLEPLPKECAAKNRLRGAAIYTTRPFT